MPAGLNAPPPEVSGDGSAESLFRANVIPGDTGSGVYKTPRNPTSPGGSVQSLLTWARAVASNVLRARRVQPGEIDLVAARTVTTAGAIDATDEKKLLVFNSATPITMTLLALSLAPDGFEFYVLNLGAGTVTLDPSGSEQIAGASTVDLPTGMSWTVKSVGATLGWRLLGRVAIGRIPGAGAVAGGLITTNSAGDITGIAAATAALPRGYIDGLTIANNATDLTNDIDIGAGVCRNTANTLDVSLASTLVKQLDAWWVAGTNAGGRDTGSIADGTWHVWLIRDTTTAVVDALFSLSATAPTVPSGWATVRRLGAVLRESGALVRFTQIGDEFRRAGFVNGINTTNAGTSQVSDTIAGLPAGIKVRAVLSVIVSNTTLNHYAVFGDPDGPSLPTPSATVFHHSAVGGGGAEFPALLTIPTNTSRQIARLFSATGSLNKYVVTALGWIDARGKDA
jgi:hypothetical protein